jgi:hypothetical protein
MTAIKKKITSKDWNPKRLLGQAETVRRLMLGRLLGVATGLTKATSNTGEVLEGVTGQFKYMDALDDVAVPVYSGVLWFPSGFGLDIIHALKQDGADAIKFAFDVGVQRAENPAGYEWLFAPLVEPAKDNPLEQLESAVVNKPAMIEQQTSDAPELPKTDEPEGEKAEAPKAKGKAKEPA